MRDQKFTFLCSKQERQLLAELANTLHRSQGDTVRFVLRLFADDLLRSEQGGNPHNQILWRNHESQQINKE